MINPRKLAAIDVVLLGSRFIIAEFAIGVTLGLALGAFILLRALLLWQFALGVYLILLGLNYVPMLVYAIAFTKGRSARAELGEELDDKRAAIAKYRRQSLLLLVPVLPVVIALRRHTQRTRGNPKPRVTVLRFVNAVEVIALVGLIGP